MWGARPAARSFLHLQKGPKNRPGDGRGSDAGRPDIPVTSAPVNRRSTKAWHALFFGFQKPFLLAHTKEMVFGKFVPKGEALDSLVSLRKTKEMVSGKSFPKAKPLDVEGGSSMTIQDKWGSLDEATRRCYHQVATDPQFLREFYAFREISAYLRHVEIPLARASGPYYLTECYQLYRVEGMDPSPDMLAMVAEAYDRRIFHVRRALYLLRQKLEQRDPQAAERRGEGLYRFLGWLFQEVEKKALPGDENRCKIDENT